VAFLMTRARYRHQRKALAGTLIFFVPVFAMMVPGRGGQIEDVALALIVGCVLITAYQLAALLMNGPDDV